MAIVCKKKQEIKAINSPQISNHILFTRVAKIIEGRKYRAATHVNQETTMMFWEVGHYINSVILDSKHAEYGKNILTALSAKLSWSLETEGVFL